MIDLQSSTPTSTSDSIADRIEYAIDAEPAPGNLLVSLAALLISLAEQKKLPLESSSGNRDDSQLGGK